MATDQGSFLDAFYNTWRNVITVHNPEGEFSRWQTDIWELRICQGNFLVYGLKGIDPAQAERLSQSVLKEPVLQTAVASGLLTATYGRMEFHTYIPSRGDTARFRAWCAEQ